MASDKKQDGMDNMQTPTAKSVNSKAGVPYVKPGASYSPKSGKASGIVYGTVGSELTSGAPKYGKVPNADRSTTVKKGE